MEILKVINKGMYASVQDLGRFGYKKYGVPQSGAMDEYAMRCADIMVGNEESAAVIEITYGGFECVFLCDISICVTGGDMAISINDVTVKMWAALRVKKGDVLKVGNGGGFRAYLAVNGSIKSKNILGSQSTYERAGFSKPIINNQIIYGHEPKVVGEKAAQENEIYKYNNIIRFIKGPHKNFFKRGYIKKLCCEEYKVSAASDRMGIRLDGKAIGTKDKSLLSCPLPIGAIQVPPLGQPIVTMADSQVTGGYPIIGCVISADIGKLSQCKPDSGIIFQEVSVEAAAGIKRTLQENIDSLKKRDFTERADREFNIYLNGKKYFVQVNYE